MLQKRSSAVCWGLGLTDDQATYLYRYFGKEHTFSFWPTGQLPGLHAMESDDPCLIWVSSEGLRSLQSLPPACTKHLDLIPKILLLHDGYTLEDFESATDHGIAEIIRPPFTQHKIESIMHKALEVQTIHQDMVSMTREIMLERELLERKNAVLTFLVDFLSNTSKSLDLEQILQTSFQGLGKLFSVQSMHAVLWQHGTSGVPHVALHIAAPKHTPAYLKWKETLLGQAVEFMGDEITVEEHQLPLSIRNSENLALMPSQGSLLTLPIAVGEERFGVIMLLAEISTNLGRDHAMALESAINHLSLTIRNAKQFHTMQLHADYDALTKIHSRRHFDSRLTEEMSRVSRYNASLSLIMLDIDHFKDVNDTYGHHVGDQVLRQVASIIASTIRGSDYCARYGGEEFCILLPHSEKIRAIALAERLRHAVSVHDFSETTDSPLHLTISLGISYLLDKDKTEEMLIQEADCALYAAKAGGRNCTRDHDAVIAMKTQCAV